MEKKFLKKFKGSEDRKLLASLRTNADSIVFDLEDGVAYNRKKEARVKVFNALEVSIIYIYIFYFFFLKKKFYLLLNLFIFQYY